MERGVFHLYIFVFIVKSVVVSCADGERCAKKKADCHLPLWVTTDRETVVRARENKGNHQKWKMKSEKYETTMSPDR